MNLLCPNCQKMLTVPEEFAGQMMKCPLCNGTFTVPGLPGSAAPSFPPPAPEPDHYSVRNDPLPPPPAPPEPPPPEPTTTPAPPSTSSLPMEDYRRALTVWFSPKVLPWIAPVCLLLVFVLQFFSWDGLYPGGEPAVTGMAWYAAFGAYSVDGDLKQYTGPGELKPILPVIENEKYKPGASVLTIFYLLFFFPALVVTIASVVINMIHVKLPPQVEKLLPWRWGIVAAVNLVLFLFLGLQLLLGFSLDSRYREWVDSEIKKQIKDNPTSKERKEADAHRGELLEMVGHTIWLRLVVVLHLVAMVSALLMFWISQRGTRRPFPKLELRW